MHASLQRIYSAYSCVALRTQVGLFSSVHNRGVLFMFVLPNMTTILDALARSNIMRTVLKSVRGQRILSLKLCTVVLAALNAKSQVNCLMTDHLASGFKAWSSQAPLSAPPVWPALG